MLRNPVVGLWEGAQGRRRSIPGGDTSRNTVRWSARGPLGSAPVSDAGAVVWGGGPRRIQVLVSARRCPISDVVVSEGGHRRWQSGSNAQGQSPDRKGRLVSPRHIVVRMSTTARVGSRQTPPWHARRAGLAGSALRSSTSPASTRRSAARAVKQFAIRTARSSTPGLASWGARRARGASVKRQASSRDNTGALQMQPPEPPTPGARGAECFLRPAGQSAGAALASCGNESDPWNGRPTRPPAVPNASQRVLHGEAGMASTGAWQSRVACATQSIQSSQVSLINRANDALSEHTAPSATPGCGASMSMELPVGSARQFQ